METISVAIVEDLDEIRNALKLLIGGSEGFECEHVFTNAEEALLKLPGIKPDVVLMDINLPGKNGIQCIKELKEVIPATQFMMCTIFDDNENIFEALRSGATGYLLKRTQPAQILEAIRDLHTGGSPMSSEIARNVVLSMQNQKKVSAAADDLTKREHEILEFLSRGYSYKEIAAELFISTQTVKKHIHNIYEKLQVQTRIGALNKVFHK